MKICETPSSNILHPVKSIKSNIETKSDAFTLLVVQYYAILLFMWNSTCHVLLIPFCPASSTSTKEGQKDGRTPTFPCFDFISAANNVQSATFDGCLPVSVFLPICYYFTPSADPLPFTYPRAAVRSKRQLPTEDGYTLSYGTLMCK